MVLDGSAAIVAAPGAPKGALGLLAAGAVDSSPRARARHAGSARSRNDATDRDDRFPRDARRAALSSASNDTTRAHNPPTRLT